MGEFLAGFPLMAIIRLMAGFMFCFTGYGLLRTAPKFIGFVGGGILAVEIGSRFLSLPDGWETLAPIGMFLLGGLIGLLLASLLYMVMAILGGVVLGGGLGYAAGFLLTRHGDTRQLAEALFQRQPLSDLQMVLMLVGGLAVGLLAIRFDELILMATTALLGALFLMAATVQLAAPTTAILRNDVFVFFAWAVLGLFGLYWQNRHPPD